MRVGIIGGGVAGLSCAAALVAQGVAVTVFDKGRKPGGRVATRRVAPFVFDHGAQYVTARSPAFRKIMATGESEGLIGRWRPRLRKDRDDFAGESVGADDPWYVGLPDMSALVRALAPADLTIRSCRVEALEPGQHGWRLSIVHSDPAAVAEDVGSEKTFDWLVLTAPAPQTAALLPVACDFAEALGRAVYAPCLTVMAAWAQPLPVAWDVMADDEGGIAWAARNSSKPRRSSVPDSWVLHGQPGWSARHLGADPASIAPRLLAAFDREVRIDLPAPRHLMAHRWRYARVIRPVGEACLVDRAHRIGACGDWCVGPRVEAAFASGTAMAQAIVT